MNLAESLLHELKHEAAKTRQYLEIIPAGSFDWKPHEKSRSLIEVATHIAELPGWLCYTIDAEELDFAKMDYQPPVVADIDSLLDLYSDNLTRGAASLSKASDETLNGIWTLRNSHLIILALPRTAVIRDMVFNHFIHHRGQLSVYLRLLNVRLPGIYGPSADEMGE